MSTATTAATAEATTTATTVTTTTACHLTQSGPKFSLSKIAWAIFQKMGWN